MSAVPTPVLTPEQYLARERAAEFKSEYLRGEVFAMAGASYVHTRVKENVARQAGNQLQGTPCFVLSSDQRVKVSSSGLYTYPDVLIVCGEPQFEDAHVDTLLNPRVIFEILSDSTEAYDRGAKFAHYRRLPSLAEYVLVAQDRPLVERYARQNDGTWLLTAASELAASLDLASAPVRLTLADVYAGVELPANPGR